MQEIKAENINPYGKDSSKGKQVEKMFDSIAPAYDFMNTAMTFGLHRRWRDKALATALSQRSVREVADAGRPLEVLDVATGTGDVAFAIAQREPKANITGIDLSSGMLEIARKKRSDLPAKMACRLSFESGDCLHLTYPDRTFHLVTVAYGVRNFEHLLQGLREMARVLKPGGVLSIIELSRPKPWLTRTGWDLYTSTLIPLAGRLVSGDHSAYTYLPKSIAACPQRDDMAALCREAGFSSCTWKSLTLGAVTIYTAIK